VNRAEKRGARSVGKPMTCLEVITINGEICVKGNAVMLGYYDDAYATHDALAGGWFHTGDLGYIDDDGYVFITGRKKNLIILSNGKNVSAEELEEQLMHLGAVSEAVVRSENDRIVAEIYSKDGRNVDAEVEALIKENGVEDIVFLNREVSGEEKQRLLLSADVFVQTSRTEGMPLGILEALAYGLPCIVTEGTTLSSIVQDNDIGWGCGTDVDSIGRAISSAIEEKDKLKEKGERAREFARKEFEWSAISKKTVEQYKLLS
jgi:acyl-CoA synthetase (AMP-forming)/AMP-acid ligase II